MGLKKKIMHEDLQVCIEETKPTTLEWFEMAKNVVEYANESGVYDELKEYIQKPKSKKKKNGIHVRC